MTRGTRLAASARRIAIVLFALSVPLILVTGTVRIFFHSNVLYDWAVDEYSLVSATGLTQDDIHTAASSLHRYLDGSRASPDSMLPADGSSVRVFNDTEIAHLRDVKERLDWLRWANSLLVVYGLLFLVAAFFTRAVTGRDLARSVIAGCLVMLGLGAITGAAAAVMFSGAWTGFHEVLFSGGWQFDLRSDRLIQIFPPDFWQDVVLLLGAVIALEALFLAVGALAWLHFHKRAPVSSQAASPVQ